MKTLFTFLTLAGLATAPTTLFAEDSIPPTPPGSANPPASPAPVTAPASGSRVERSGDARGRAAAPTERLEMMKEKLGLTPEQVGKLKPILEKEREKAKTLREDSSLSGDEKRTKMRELIKSASEQMKPILTPEQQAILLEGLEKRREELEKRRVPEAK